MENQTILSTLLLISGLILTSGMAWAQGQTSSGTLTVRAELDGEVRRRRAPEMWLDLCQRFESECQELNSDIGRNLLDCRKSDENTIEIIRDDPRISLTLVYDPQTHTTKFGGLTVGDIGRLDIKVQPGTSEAKFFDMKLRLISDPAQIVRH
jgi:hypothetical protein